MPLIQRLEGSLEASSFIFHHDVASHLPHALLSSDYFAIYVFLWPPWPHCESRFFVFTSFVCPSPRQDLTQHGGSTSLGCILPCFSVVLKFPLTIIQLLPRKPELFQQQCRLDGEPGSLALQPKERLETGLALSFFFIHLSFMYLLWARFTARASVYRDEQLCRRYLLCEWPIQRETQKYRITTPGMGTEGTMRETTKARIT